MDEDDLPRLPSVNPSLPAGLPLRNDEPATERVSAPTPLVATHTASGSWSDYDEPELLPLRWSARLVTLARVALFVWAGIVVGLAFRLRERARNEEITTGALSTLAVVGAVGAVVLAGAGGYWSDRVTQNVHRLSGRLPSRIRSLTAWWAPVLWASLLSLTVLRLEPNESIDLRPVIIVPIFALALWRPFALIRRLLKSLIRIDSDLLLATAYVLDLAAFGAMWWRLQTLPEVLTPANADSVGPLVSLGFIAAGALGFNVLVWEVLRRDIRRAVAHRQIALRTRHHHRQLRAHGIDPLDRAVREALVRVAGDGAALASSLGLPDTQAPPVLPDVVPTLPEAPLPWVERERLREATTNDSMPPVETDGVAVVDSTPQVPVVEPDATVPDLDEEPASAADENASVDDAEAVADDFSVGAESDAAVVDPVTSEASTDGGVATEPGDGSVAEEDEAEHSVDVADRGLPSEQDPIDDGDPAGSSGAVDVRDRLARAVESAEGPRSNDRSRDRLLDRLAERARAFQDDGVEPDPLEALFSWSASSDRTGESDHRESIVARLERLGITPTQPTESTPQPSFDSASGDDAADRTLVVNRVFALEFARYAMLVALAAAVACSLWWVVSSVDVGEQLSASSSVDGLDRLETARRAALGMLLGAMALTSLWASLVGHRAARLGADPNGTMVATVATVVATASAAFAVATQEQFADTTGLIAAIVCLGAALVARRVLVSLHESFGQVTSVTSLSMVALTVAIATGWAGGLLRQVGAPDSFGALLFFGGLTTVSLAVTTVSTAVGSDRLLEAIMLADISDDAVDDEPENVDR